MHKFVNAVDAVDFSLFPHSDKGNSRSGSDPVSEIEIGIRVLSPAAPKIDVPDDTPANPEPERVLLTLPEMAQAPWRTITPLTLEVAHVDDCCCGSCSMPPEEPGAGDTANLAEMSETGITQEVTQAAFSPLGDLANFLTSGYWSGGTSTTDFRYHNLGSTGNDPNNGILYYNLSGYSQDTDGLTEDRKFLVREAFKLFEATLGINFEETNSTDTGVVDFFFRDNDSGAYASSSRYSNGELAVSYINLAQSWSGGTSTYDDYTLQTILHEIGHALGLGHQGFYNGGATFGVDNVFENDSWQASMMSYFSQTENTNITASYEFLQTPMTADWIALDVLYGSQGYGTFNAFTEDTVWGFNTTVTSEVSDIWARFSEYANRTASTIVDGGGTDTLDLSGYSNNTKIDLRPSTSDALNPYVSDIGGRIGNLSIAEGTIIENVVGGAGSETFIGNDADNEMTGNGGDDTFVDSLGNDTYFGGAGSDTVTFTGTFSSFSFSIGGAFLQVIDVFTDLVDSTVEWLGFSDGTRSFAEIVDGLGSNTSPVSADDAASTDENTVLSGNVLANDSDPDGDPLQVSAVNGQTAAVGTQITLASGALLTLNADGSYAYDPNGQFDTLEDGQTAVDGFNYEISDGRGGFSTSTVTLTINGVTPDPVNTAPVAVNDSETVAEDATVSGNVLSNDSDADGDTLSVVAVQGQASAVGQPVQLASGAWVTLNANGAYDYDPNGAFDSLSTGETATDSFTYGVSDGFGGTDTATVTITVTGSSAPVVTTAMTIDFENTPLGVFVGVDGIDATGVNVRAGTVLSGSRFGESDAMTLIATGEDFDLDAMQLGSAGGRVRIKIEAWDDGVLIGSTTVNTRAGKVSDVSFGTAYDSIDEVRLISTGTFYLDEIDLVTSAPTSPGGNLDPDAVDDAFGTAESAATTFNLLANDSDPDSGTPVLTAIQGDTSGSVTLASGAVVTFGSDGAISYDPNGAFDSLYDGTTAADSFMYEIADGQGGSALASAIVTITGEGTPPPAPTSYAIDFEGAGSGGRYSEDGFVFDNVAGTSSGIGVTSGSQAAQSLGDSLTLTREDGSGFDLESAFVTAASGRGKSLLVEGYDDNGTLIATESLRIWNNRETQINFNDTLFDLVDSVTFTVSGGLIIDDMLLLA